MNLDKLNLKIERCKVINLKFIDDGIDGNLFIAESLKQIPFEIKRVYFINNLKNRSSVRGRHAHKKLKQVLFCINGSFELELDDGISKENIYLSEPNIGIYMEEGVWHVMKNFSHDCIIFVLASDLYEESDYIRDYSDFLASIKKCNSDHRKVNV